MSTDRQASAALRTAGPTASVGAAPSVLTSFALVSLDFSASVDPAGGSLTYSSTMDVVPATSATTLVDATTSTPDFTPDKIGAYSGLLTVTDVGGRTDTSRWYREVRSALTLSIDAVADQLTLAAISLNSTASGGIGTLTYDWTVNGATTGLSDATAADPTFTPSVAGPHVAVCTVTDAAGQTRTASEPFTIGDADRRIQKTHADWTLAENATDFTVSTTATVGGQVHTRFLPGTAFGFASTADVGLSMDPNSNDCGVSVPGNAQGVTLETDVVYYAALAAGTLGDNSDTFKIIVSSGAIYAVAIARKSSGGVQQIGTENATGAAYETTAGTGQVRQLAFRIRGYLCEVYYSEAAFSGAFPACSEMTKATTAPAGFFTYDSMPGNDTTDSRAPATDTVYWLVATFSTGAVVMTNSEIRVAA